MRTPGQEKIKNDCRAAIRPIMERHGLGPPKSIIMDTEGWVNPCFFVDNSIVIRFNARDPHLPKFQREKFIFDRLEDMEIPTPKCLFLDESRELVPFDVLVTEMLPGKNIEADWKTLDIQTRNILSEKAGRILATIHEHRLSFFGELANKEPFHKTKVWSDYIKTRLSYHLKEVRELLIFDSDVSQRCWNIFEHHLPALSGITSPSIVYVDFHFGNLLHLDGNISGVLDFEWAFSGDPLYDFCSLDSMEKIWPGSKKPFLKGYGKKEFSKLEKSRIGVYRMIRNLEMCAVAKKHLSKKEALEFSSITLSQLFSMEKATNNH